MTLNTKSQLLRFDGSATSANAIMDIVGTKGVNNGRERLYIRGDYLDKGDSLSFDETHWWIRHSWMKPSQEPQKFERERKDND